MADDEKNPIIAESPDDEDEIVIQAGIPQPAPDNAGPEEEAAAVQARPEQQRQKQAEAAPKAAPHADKDAYQETTREDLDATGPLPKARLAIIVCAILLIVGFLLYYNFMLK